MCAGGFDSSGRPFEIIFGEQSTFELSVSHFDPSVSLSVSRDLGDGVSIPSTPINHIVTSYTEPRFGLRLKVNEQVNCAAQLERPFRFKTQYLDDELSYQQDNNVANSQVAAPIDSEYSSESLTLACGIAFPINASFVSGQDAFLSFIAGPKVQRIEGEFSTDLTNQRMGKGDNYRATLQGSSELGYLLGLAYEIPSIAFRASLFFHNEVEHDLSGSVVAPLPDFSGLITRDARGKTITPQALNLRVQSGIAEDWLAFIELRWGDWSSLNQMNVQAAELSSSLVLFKNDTLNYKLGLGAKVSDRLTLGGYIESYMDLNPPNMPEGIDGTNLRNPQGDRFSFAFGGKYLLTSSLSISAGGSYYYIEAGRFSDGFYTVSLDKSDALALGTTLNYQF